MNQPPQPPPNPYGQYPQYPQYPQGQPPREAMGALDLIVPTNPLAAVACWTGVLALFTCYGGIVLGPIALVTGIISLKKGAMIRESSYGRGSSLARSWVGIVTGTLATLIGFAAIVLAVLSHR